MTFLFATAACGADDVQDESELAFASAGAALEAAGGAFRDVVRTRLLYATVNDYPAMAQVRAPLFADRFADVGFPTATGFITGGRGADAPQFELEVIAHAGRRTANSSQVIHQFGDVVPPFAHANEAGGVAFISGQTAFELDGSFPERTAPEQAAKVLKTLAPILAEVDRSVSDLMGLTLFVAPAVSTEDLAAVQQVVRQFLAAHGATPVVTWLGVRALVFPGAVLGMEAVAGGPTITRGTEDDAQAATSGELLIATATASGLVDRAVPRAVDALVAATTQTGVDIGPGALVTVWYADGDDEAVRTAVVRALGGRIPAPALSVVPMRAITGTETITIELYAAAAEPTNTEERRP